MPEERTIIMEMSDTIPIPFLRELIEMIEAHRDEIEERMRKESTP